MNIKCKFCGFDPMKNHDNGMGKSLSDCCKEALHLNASRFPKAFIEGGRLKMPVNFDC